MPKNYYIGIGGTGARVAEALVHLCAAGFGPDELTLFLVDPDQANGNLSRTRHVIDQYNECQKRFRDRNSRRVRIFHTRINTPNPMIWSIFNDAKVTLREHLELDTMAQANPALADFVSILFSKQELREKLDEGFRGHPSIGAVVMSSPPTTADPWKTFWADVGSASRPGDIRVFLAGSVFGGTGAAGVPTFGSPQMLKGNPQAQSDRGSRIHLGACLVLPYFHFEMPSEQTEEEGRLFVTFQDFPIATKAALQYYDEKNLAFDDLYFLGDSVPRSVGKFSAGSKTQENRPHAIELAAGLAALDFYREADGRADGQPLYLTAARDDETVGWESLPVSRNPEQLTTHRNRLQLLMAVMTTFSYAVATLGEEVLEGEKDYAWFDRTFGKAGDPLGAEGRESVLAFAKYARDYFLRWASGIDDRSGVNLVDATRLWASDDALIPWRQQIPISKAVKGLTSKQHTFDQLIKEMNDVDITNRSMTASDKFINLFAEGALRYCVANYGLNKALLD